MSSRDGKKIGPILNYYSESDFFSNTLCIATHAGSNRPVVKYIQSINILVLLNMSLMSNTVNNNLQIIISIHCMIAYLLLITVQNQSDQNQCFIRHHVCMCCDPSVSCQQTSRIHGNIDTTGLSDQDQCLTLPWSPSHM